MSQTTLKIDMSTDQKTPVIYADEILETDLLKIFNREAFALCIPNYYPTELCRTATQRLLSNDIEHYLNAPSIGRAGMAFYETENKPEKVEKYYQKARGNMKRIRNVFSPYTSPMDQLRLDLQEIWTAGANIENIHDRKMFTGLCRLLEPGVDFLPHQDIFHLDSENNLRAYSLEGQLAANIYLDIADETGGELDLWSTGFSDQEYPHALDENSYGISRHKLPPPAFSLKPGVGDLVLFNGRNLHAVRPSQKPRVSIACFVGYRGEQQPLTYWS